MAKPSVVLPDPELANDAERFPFANFDADPVDCLDVADHLAQNAALDRKPDLQVLGLDDHGGVRLQRGWVRFRLGGEKSARVGMLGRDEHALHRPLLDNLAPFHDADTVGDLAHDPEVMGDEQHGHAEPGLNVLQELEDLRLHGDVERGGRLVGDQKVGLVGERHGDHRALALPAGELVRIAPEAALRIANADLVQQIDDALARGRPGDAAMEQQCFADLLLDRVQGIERGHRLLEDDRNLVAAHTPHLRFGQSEELLAFEQDRSTGMPRGRMRQKLHDR